jgi:hypothetical protein
MAREARTEAVRIETARIETHRLLLRRKAELADFGREKKRRNLLEPKGTAQVP